MHFPLFKFNTIAKPNLFIIAGPCVIESEELCQQIASKLAELSSRYSIDFIFKASYDKANRMAASSFRGVGKTEGLAILDRIKKDFGLPILTDIHESDQATEVASVADVIQIPALLCRQTDLLVAASKTGKWVNIKKGQFLAPEDMEHAIKKCGDKVWVTERGSCFGYKRLVVDYTGFSIMKRFGKPLIFDATHSVQIPGGGFGCSSGNRDLAMPLAKAALAVGVDGLFFEVHPDPEKALCDGPNSLYLTEFEKELPKLLELYKVIQGSTR